MITVDSTKESVHEFAQAVRDALADLPADEADELTDGLEADLAERAEELGGTDAFGDPLAYADELRTSAGLPPRSAARRRRTTPQLRAVWDSWWHSRLARVRATPFGAWLLDLAVALRPVWWVIRGWTVYQMLTLVLWRESFGVVPVNGGASAELAQWAILLALVLFSVQWGRGRWMPGRWPRVVLVLASIGSVLAVVPVTAAAIDGAGSWRSYSADSTEVVSSSPGLYNNGRQVFNVFAYDAAGRPLTDVRLYDQDGHPLTTVPDTSPGAFPSLDGNLENGQMLSLVPSSRADGAAGWSVYPLQASNRTVDPAPFPQVQPLSPATPADADAAPTPAPSATPTPSATPLRDARPTPSATPTPTPGG
ncbi:MAG TPA: hypothetical protein VGC45_14795 [Gryllotalpicola sp.]